MRTNNANRILDAYDDLRERPDLAGGEAKARVLVWQIELDPLRRAWDRDALTEVPPAALH